MKKDVGGQILNLTGQRSGKLLIIALCGIGKRRHAMWLVRCDCGTFKKVEGAKLTNLVHPTLSCGCGGIENREKYRHRVSRAMEIRALRDEMKKAGYLR